MHRINREGRPEQKSVAARSRAAPRATHAKSTTELKNIGFTSRHRRACRPQG
jgi:hypothetical protein